jgi:glycosyltransferase involved in cell wall biosynthesis
MILIITAVFPPEPVVSAGMTFNLAEKLAEKYDVTVISPAPTRPLGYDHKAQEFNPERFAHIVLNSFTYPRPNIIGRMLESYSFGRHALKYLKKRKGQIDCCYVNTWPLISQFILLRYLKHQSFPVITHVQDTYPESITMKIPLFGKFLNRLLLPVDRFILQNSDRVITSGNGIRKHLISTRNLDESNVSMIYNWRNDKMFIDFAQKRPKRPVNPVLTFMFLGNLCRTAAVHIVIKGFCQAKLEKSKLIIAGSGPEKENLIHLAKDLKNCDIEFCVASDKDVPEIQSKADILILSLKKNTAQFAVPSKLPAYMFSGKAVIACVESESDTSFIIQNAKCGWIVPPENITALAEQMRNIAMLKNGELLKFGENGFNYAMKYFSTENNLRKLVSEFTAMVELKEKQEIELEEEVHV